MSLFRTGDFTLHSGQSSAFKIDCDYLTVADIRAISRLALVSLPSFSAVWGIPDGGRVLAAVLRKHIDPSSNRVLIVDDLLATGGTAAAAASLVTKAGGRVVEAVFFIELSFLEGRVKMREVPVRSLVDYQ